MSEFQFGLEPWQERCDQKVAWGVPLEVLHGRPVEPYIFSGEWRQECSDKTSLSVNGDAGIALTWSRGGLGDHAPEQIEEFTYERYCRSIGILRGTGFGHPVRFWNVIPRINHREKNVEIYQRFCRGRLRAFREHGIQPEAFPAASAVGSKDDSYCFGVLASRSAPVLLSNARQVDAYRYPPEYGPVSPSFARGAIHGTKLYLSGTASILGHESRHIGDVERQTSLTLENLEFLRESAAQKHPASWNWKQARLRIYLRHRSDLSVVQRIIGASTMRDSESTYLLADICREELLVEIEAILEDLK